MAADPSPRTSEQEALDTLTGELSLAKTTVAKATTLGVSTQQLGPGLASIGGYAFLLAGNMGWLSTLLAGALMFPVIWTIRVLSRRYVTVGGAMTYVLSTGQHRMGQFIGVAQVLTYVVIAASGPAAVAVSVFSFFHTIEWDVSESIGMQLLVLVVVGVVTTVPALMGLEFQYRISLYLGLLGVPLTIWVTAQALTTGGDIDWSQSVGWDRADFAQSMLAVPILLSFFTGLDDNTTLAVGTDNPQRNAFRIVSRIFWIVLGIYFAAVVIQAPLMVEHVEEIYDGQSPLSLVAKYSGMGYLMPIIDLVAVLALVASTPNTVLSGGRVFAAAAAAGLLPRALTKVGERNHVPNRAVFTLGVIGIIVPVLLTVVVGMQPVETSVAVGEFLTYIYALPYIATGIATIVLLRRERRGAGSVVIIGAGIVGWIGFLIWSLSQGFESFESFIPWISAGATILLFLLLVLFRRQKVDVESLYQMDEVE